MGNTLSEVAGKEIAVAHIERYGEKLILPMGMKIPVAIDLLQRRMKFEDEVTSFNADYDVMPWDGAYALDRCLVEKFGWAPATSTPGFWGDEPPQVISVQIDYGQHAQVAWGRFSLPNVQGYVETGVAKQANGRFKFTLSATVKRMDEQPVKELFDMVREYLKHNSIYRGKAVKIRFLDAKGNDLAFPTVEYLNAKAIRPDSIIYSDEVYEQVQVNLFTPITRVNDCIKNGVAVKRGVLLGGVFGTGKTMAASVASRLAVDNGVTYVYTPRAAELKLAIEFAKQYQSPACVVFCEDVDRVTDGKRSVAMDDLLNIIDGIDTKNANIITVLTTNELGKINPAMLRPGRLDAVIEVTPPDAKAAQRLVRLYGAEAIPADEDLTEVGTYLAGQIPAMIAEVVKRAKLYQIGTQEPGTPVSAISAQALLYAAKTMRAQVDLMERRIKEEQVTPPSFEDKFRETVAESVAQVGHA